MPRKSTAETESLWVPLAARCVCYACGVHLSQECEKNNCRLCFDVFCPKCLSAKRLLPVHYGYTDPQPVCTACDLLLTSFVKFASQVHRRGAGILLPPRQAVIIASSNLPSDPHKAHQPGGAIRSGDEEGFFSRLLRRFRDTDAPSPSSASNGVGSNNDPNGRQAQTRAADGSGQSGSAKSEQSRPNSSNNKSNNNNNTAGNSEVVSSSFCNIPQSVLAGRSIRVKDACCMYMVGWRPLNPSTAMVVGKRGDVHLFLKDVVRVVLGASTNTAVSHAAAAAKRASLSPSASNAAANKRHSMLQNAAGKLDEGGGGALNDGRITVELRGGYYCQLLVGSVETTTPHGNRSSGDEEDRSDDEDSDNEHIADFTSDPTAARELVERLSGLIRFCRGHFALSQASMALHVDLCPS